ncbi:MAG: 2-C-methyl-D-erythritol 4-phosphate cytidylyltransferase [Candidatus Eremiobacteraeota bacterium]|jgi:2-C-methyl-D-erythritol 4-phosphate cytidylyltransferase|nr:2-C-methyl-D-erythritol 4-phosphate cytidylyltransferase [Candidatus Eremiobacteraeota bacterium]
MIWGAVIVAAGHGTRFGGPKQLVDLGGKPMIAWSIEAFAALPEIAELVIVTEPEFVERMESLAHARVKDATVIVVRGGPDRQASVRHGLEALSDDVGAVLVHDGARPLVRTSDVRNGMRPVRPGTASLLATPVIDTIKVVDATGKVTRTLARGELWSAQTPQFATARDLRRAHAEAARHGQPPATDDAALLERAGLDVVVVEGVADNFKVTVPGDLARAELLLRERGPQGMAEEEVLLVECYVEPRAVDAVLRELEARDARIDEVDRDLPSATIIRAYATNGALRGFGTRLNALAGEDALYTAHLSHHAPRTSALPEREH